MFDWLKQRGENSRVYMCTKELKWDLERASSVRKASILVLAILHRSSLEDGAGFPAAVFETPSAFERDDLMQFYAGIEGARNNNNRQSELAAKALKSLVSQPPSFMAEHASAVSRGLEVWMCSVGGAIKPDLRDEVRMIWELLSDSAPYASQAVLGFHAVEQFTDELFGASDYVLRGLDPEGFAFETHAVPADYRPKMRL